MRPDLATIIYNPKSGRGFRRDARLARMVRLLGARGVTATAVPTTAPNTGADIARNAIACGAGLIVSYGGDGTLNEILQGVAGSKTAVALWPGGTENVAAKDLGMPRSLPRLADVMARRKTVRVSLGLAEGADWRRYFFMFAGIGLDAAICRAVQPRLKERTGQFAFWMAGLGMLCCWREDRFRLTANGHKFESGFSLVGNGKGYGGGIIMATNARLEDDEFEVFVMPAGAGRRGYLRALVRLLLRDRERAGAAIVKCRELHAEPVPASDSPMVSLHARDATWVEADGEVIGRLPMRFRIVPDALSIVVP